MAQLEINLPGQVYERLKAESEFSGEPMDSIISRALTMYFAQQVSFAESPFTIFRNNTN